MENGLVCISDDTGAARASNLSVNIIAVHGLGANKDYAWVKKVEDKRVNWLKDLLPKTFATAYPRIHAKIFCYNYDTRWLGTETCSQRVTTLAGNLLEAWSQLRPQNLATVFIAHSYGGLVVEKAIVQSRQPSSPFGALGKTLGGVILLGTPHRGSPSEKWGSKLARAAALLGLGQENALIDTREESAEIRDLIQEFAWSMIGANMCKARRVVIFFENKKSDYGRRLPSWLPGIKWEDIVSTFGFPDNKRRNSMKSQVVPESSAEITGFYKLALDADHFELNKFGDISEGNYGLVATNIVRIVHDIRMVYAQGGEHSLARKPFFEVPNQRERYFVGRSTTLLEIETARHRSDRRGPRIVMLHGSEGRGKTQIALAYCERQRSKVGVSAIDVFWVDATTRTNRLKGLSLLYYSIGLPPHQMNDEERARSVIRYLATSDLNWLLVYDGFGDERSTVSPSSIRECLPNSSGPGGTIIITTRSESCKELLQDYIDAEFEIGGLDSVDGATLLLKRSGIEQTPASIVDAERIAMLLNGKPPDILRVARDLAAVIGILGKGYTNLLQHSASFRSCVATLPKMQTVTEDKTSPPTVDGGSDEINLNSDESSQTIAHSKRHGIDPDDVYNDDILTIRSTNVPGFGRFALLSAAKADPVQTARGGSLQNVFIHNTVATDHSIHGTEISNELQALQEPVLSSLDQGNEPLSFPVQQDPDIIELCLQFEETEKALDQAKLDIQDWVGKHNVLQSSLDEANRNVWKLEGDLLNSCFREKELRGLLEEARVEKARLLNILLEHDIDPCL